MVRFRPASTAERPLREAHLLWLLRVVVRGHPRPAQEGNGPRADSVHVVNKMRATRTLRPGLHCGDQTASFGS